jgi:uncharacterized protein YbbC (DUF1343 family)
MNMNRLVFLLGISLFLFIEACTQTTPSDNTVQIKARTKTVTKRVKTGAEVLIERQLSILKGKRVAIVTHPAAVVFGKIHTVDTLLKAGIQIVKVFAPEHGFRGEGEAGENIKTGKDHKTGLPVISLYGKNMKPTADHLKDVDVVLFDVQDVGARFYTYISTLTYVMEACAENHIPFYVLDRPNPNGNYVDGPVMEKKYCSFVGMHEVPIVYGMTIGEYAQMVNEEGWIKQKADLKVIPMENYRRDMEWEATGLEWIPPSPNLPTPFSARVYPLLCWYEATIVSVGRGTDTPFEVLGFPLHQGAEKQWKKDSILNEKTVLKIEGLEAEAVRFQPRSIKGKALEPPYLNQTCWGFRIKHLPLPEDRFRAGVALLDNMYREYHAYFSNRDRQPQTPFFNPPNYFERLSGTPIVRKLLTESQTSEVICKSWQQQVHDFKQIRKKYLRYR